MVVRSKRPLVTEKFHIAYMHQLGRSKATTISVLGFCDTGQESAHRLTYLNAYYYFDESKGVLCNEAP
jgi:hypothetical protein